MMCKQKLHASQRQVLPINRYSRELEGRSPAYNSHPISAPQSKLRSFLRFIRRSGGYGSYASYNFANLADLNKHYNFGGWRRGCLVAAVSVGIVLLGNLIFTVWATSTSKSAARVGTISGCRVLRIWMDWRRNSYSHSWSCLQCLYIFCNYLP
jgi:hypothetical protein